MSDLDLKMGWILLNNEDEESAIWSLMEEVEMKDVKAEQAKDGLERCDSLRRWSPNSFPSSFGWRLSLLDHCFQNKGRERQDLNYPGWKSKGKQGRSRTRRRTKQ